MKEYVLTQSEPPGPGGPPDPLNPAQRLILEEALAYNSGTAAWKARKRSEATELVELSQAAPPGRLHISWIDLREDLRALLFLKVPVARRPGAENTLAVADGALIGLS